MTSQPPAGDLEGPGGSDDAGSTDPIGSAVADPAATTTAGTDLELAKAHARTGVNKTVWILAAVAVVALGIGLVIGRFVKS
ncbi:MAG: hypothetical protein J0H73_08270, partial [Salana multivorans]|nr:hypothetical protein [Salana multivorans]